MQRSVHERRCVAVREACCQIVADVASGGFVVCMQKGGGKGIVLLVPGGRANIAQGLVEKGGERDAGQVV